MKIQVLGSGCPTCKTLHKAVEEVVKKLNLDTKVEYSTDIAKMVELGAMSSPVFAIDGEIISAGKVPTSEEIENALKSNCCGGESTSCYSGEKVEKTSCCSPSQEVSQKESGCCRDGSCLAEKKSKCCLLNALKKFFSRFFKK